MADITDMPVELKERAKLGKGLKSLRTEGLIPAVIHNHGQPSIHVMAPEVELEKIYRAAGKHHPLELKVGNQDFLALIKDVHMNPVKRRMQHVVFQAIKRDEKVEAEVPIKLEGEIPAERVGLQILHHLDHVEVEALPAKLPDELIADVTVLVEVGDKINVGDLKVPEGVTILTDSEQSIAAVVEPKEQVIEEPESEVAEGEEGAEGAEGETGAEGEEKPAAEAGEGAKEGSAEKTE